MIPCLSSQILHICAWIDIRWYVHIHLFPALNHVHLNYILKMTEMFQKARKHHAKFNFI